MADATARLALPFIAPGQAQKELFHNEALARVDALVQASVLSIGGNQPPVAPVAGQCWIVGDAPGGGWAGQARALATWTEGGWRFVAPVTGMAVWSEADRVTARFDGQGWRIGELSARKLMVNGVAVVGVQQSAINLPNGGAVVDNAARLVITAILGALRAHGLIAS